MTGKATRRTWLSVLLFLAGTLPGLLWILWPASTKVTDRQTSRPELSTSTSPRAKEGVEPEPRARVAETIPEERVSEAESRPGENLPGTMAATDDPVGLIVHGRVLGPCGARYTGQDVSVVFTDAVGERVHGGIDGNGSYSFTGLTPGPWQGQALAVGYELDRVEIELHPGSPPVRVDFILDERARVRVRVVTPSGVPYSDANRRDPHHPASRFWPTAIATPRPPEDLVLDFAGGNNAYGTGQLWYGRVEAPMPGELGTLLLDGPPPWYVSLVVYQGVIETRRIDEPGGEVTFVYEPADLVERCGALRLALLDAETLSPCAFMEVDLSTRTSSQPGRRRADAHGQVHVAPLAPGAYRLTILSARTEGRTLEVVIGAGQTTDLGQILVDRRLSIEGRVILPQGEDDTPILTCFELLPGTGDPDPGTRRNVYPDASGSFWIRDVAPTRHVLHVSWSHQGLACHPALVDTSAGPASDVVIRAVPHRKIVLHPPDESWRSLRIALYAASGLRILRSPFWNSQPWAISVAPGEHRLVVTDAEGNVLEEHSLGVEDEPVIVKIGPP